MMRAHMAAAVTEEEERYVMVASRFFRVDPAAAACDGGGGGGAMTSSRRLHHHYLGSCFLCKRNILWNRDIFMYKGDAAFCSEECRQEQMDMDEELNAVARRHRLTQHKPASAELAPAMVTMMRRRPTIADLAARTPVAAS